MAGVCSASDIQFAVVLLVIIVMVVCDLLTLIIRGWLYSLVGIMIGFISTGYWAGADQNVVISQFYDPSSAAWQCNTQPFNPIILLCMLGVIIISALILWRCGRRTI